MKTTLAPFHRVFKDKTSGNKKFLSSEYLTHGKLAIVDQGQSTVAGFTDEIEASCKIKLPCVIFGDHTKKFQFQEKPFALGADGVKALEIARDVDPKYAYYAISLFRFPDGTGYSRHFKFLKEARISLPDDIAEQRRIADILDKADGIRHKRQQSLKLIDDLVKSQFIEMFGDPVTNPMGWDSGALGCKIQTIMAGESVNGEARLLEKGEKAVLKISAVTYGYFDPSEYKVIQNQKGIKKYVYPQKGDLLFSRANTRELVGATAIVPRDFPDLLLPDKLWRLTFHNGLNTYFVKHVLSTDAVRMAMSKQATGTSGSMFNISMEKLKKLTVPVPPLPLQNQFAAFVEQADKSKFTMQRQLSEIEILSSSLKQKFFA